jgi:hypothetical protein
VWTTEKQFFWRLWRGTFVGGRKLQDKMSFVPSSLS